MITIPYNDFFENPAQYQKKAELYGIKILPKKKQLNKAFSSSMSDFEDAVQAFCAKHCHISYIITRNTKDYKLSPVKTIEPMDFITILGK